MSNVPILHDRHGSHPEARYKLAVSPGPLGIVWGNHCQIVGLEDKSPLHGLVSVGDRVVSLDGHAYESSKMLMLALFRSRKPAVLELQGS